MLVLRRPVQCVHKSEAFAWTMGENGAPLIDEAKVSIECEVDGNYELEHFDHFICKILATYADEVVLNDKGKIDYHTFKPVLFEFPTYEYFVIGDKVGNCGNSVHLVESESEGVIRNFIRMSAVM